MVAREAATDPKRTVGARHNIVAFESLLTMHVRGSRTGPLTVFNTITVIPPARIMLAKGHVC